MEQPPSRVLGVLGRRTVHVRNLAPAVVPTLSTYSVRLTVDDSPAAQAAFLASIEASVVKVAARPDVKQRWGRIRLMHALNMAGLFLLGALQLTRRSAFLRRHITRIVPQARHHYGDHEVEIHLHRARKAADELDHIEAWQRGAVLGHRAAAA